MLKANIIDCMLDLHLYMEIIWYWVEDAPQNTFMKVFPPCVMFKNEPNCNACSYMFSPQGGVCTPLLLIPPHEMLALSKNNFLFTYYPVRIKSYLL